MIAQPMPVFLIPESAPFTAEQRAWLSGVLAATLLTDAQGASALGNTEAVYTAMSKRQQQDTCACTRNMLVDRWRREQMQQWAAGCNSAR